MADTLIRVHLDDSGATTGLQRLGTAMEIMERRSASGAQGLRSVEFGLRTLAAEAVGITGPLGRVAEGLLSFAGGSTLVLTVAAGIGIVTLAMRELSKESAQAAKDAKELDARLIALGAHGALVVAQKGVQPLQVEAAAIQARLRRMAGVGDALTPAQESEREGLEMRLLELQKRIADVTNQQVIPAERKVNEELRKQTEERLKHLRAQAILTAEAQGFLGLGLGGPHLLSDPFAPARGIGLGPTTFAEVRTPAPIGIGFGGFGPIDLRPRRDFDSAEVDKAAEKLSAKLAGAVALAIASVASGARGGDVGGAITGVGGALGALAAAGTPAALGGVGMSATLASLGPVGAGVSIFGTLLTLFASHKPSVTISAYEAQALAQMKEVRGEPLTTSYTVISAADDARRVQYGQGRLAAKGVITRIP